MKRDERGNVTIAGALTTVVLIGLALAAFALYFTAALLT